MDEEIIETLSSSVSTTSSNKRSSFDTKEIAKKRIKKQSTENSNGENNRSDQTSITHRFSGENVNEDNETSKFDDQWFSFQSKIELNEIKIDCSSSLTWCRNFLSEDEGSALFDQLIKELNYEQSQIKMYGKTVSIPRLQSWFAEEGIVVPELYQKQKQHIWTSAMRKIKIQLETLLDVKFDYCLVNLYRNGNDSINFHADNEAKDIIASLSLGATRRFLVRHLSTFGKTQTRRRKPLTTPEKTEYEFSLSNGFLIVMSGETQLHWKHSIPKEKQILEPRINLTFRTILNPERMNQRETRVEIICLTKRIEKSCTKKMSRRRDDDDQTDPTEISSVSSRSTGTSGSTGSASVDQPGSSSALGDSEMAGMSSTSAAYESKRERETKGSGTGEGQGAAGKPYSTSSAEP